MCNTAGNHNGDNDVRILMQPIHCGTNVVFRIMNVICKFSFLFYEAINYYDELNKYYDMYTTYSTVQNRFICYNAVRYSVAAA